MVVKYGTQIEIEIESLLSHKINNHISYVTMCTKSYKEATRVETQRVATTIYVRFKVTICLYLSPNNRASNLSTLMAVIVNKDAPHNTKLVMTAASFAYRKIPRCSRVQESKTFTVAQRGSATRPTKRSVVAKQRYKSLDGG